MVERSFPLRWTVAAENSVVIGIFLFFFLAEKLLSSVLHWDQDLWGLHHGRTMVLKCGLPGILCVRRQKWLGHVTWMDENQKLSGQMAGGQEGGPSWDSEDQVQKHFQLQKLMYEPVDDWLKADQGGKSEVRTKKSTVSGPILCVFAKSGVPMLLFFTLLALMRGLAAKIGATFKFRVTARARQLVGENCFWRRWNAVLCCQNTRRYWGAFSLSQIIGARLEIRSALSSHSLRVYSVGLEQKTQSKKQSALSY